MQSEGADVGHVRHEASFRGTLAQVSLMRSELDHPIDVVLSQGPTCSLDFCLTERESFTELRFSEIWHRGHFEPAGRLIMRPPRQAVQIRSGRGSQRAISCLLMMEELVQFFESDIQWTDPLRSASVDVNSRALKILLLRLAAEMARPGFASEMLCGALIIEIAVELRRHFQGMVDRSGVAGLASWRLDLIEERARQDGPPPSLTEMAGLCGLSVRQMCRGFQAARGVSLARYVAGLKFEQAKERLACGEAVKSVAYGLGFSSPSSFCSAFRQATGLTPGAWKCET